VHRPLAQVLIAEFVARLGIAQEFVIARDIPRRQARHLGAGGGVIGGGGEPGTILPANLVERIHRDQPHIDIEIPPAGRPKLAQAFRNCHDGRTQIEAVSTPGDRGSPPSRTV
jgi:hypothetical protein